MKTFVSTNTYQHLNLDARVKSGRVRIKLHIVDKHDPDTWYTTFKKNRVDNFVTQLRHDAKNLTASLLISIKSKEPLTFAKQSSASCDQLFDGVLFAVGNQEIKKQHAVATGLTDKGLLSLSIIPSTFWDNENKSQNTLYAGKKIGFRFVVQDSSGNTFFSHDPMVIVPDWEPN